MKSIHAPAYRALLQWLRESRVDRRLSMRDVGLRMGIPHTWVGKIETGERRLDILEYVNLCRAIGVKPTHGLALVEATLPSYPLAAEAPMPKAAERLPAYTPSRRTWKRS